MNEYKKMLYFVFIDSIFVKFNPKISFFVETKLVLGTYCILHTCETNDRSFIFHNKILFSIVKLIANHYKYDIYNENYQCAVLITHYAHETIQNLDIVSISL